MLDIRTLLMIGCLCTIFTASAIAGDAAEHSGVDLHSAAEIGYPPFSLVDASGMADGFSVELLRASLAAMGRGVDFRVGPWPQIRELLERGEIEALPLVGRTPEREKIYDFTFPYMSLHGAIVVRQGTTEVRTLADLKGRQVAVMKGDNAEEFLLRQDHGIDIQTTLTFEQALEELSQGRHDAVVIQRLVALRLLNEANLTNLQVVNAPIEGFRQDFCFAVREGDRQTLALLNEGLALIMADGTYRRLHAKWFAALQLPGDRPIIIGGDHNYPPFEYLDKDGRPAGFAVEMTQAIAREMNLPVQIHLGPWQDIMEGLNSGEIDAVQGMFYSAERDRIFEFSPSYLITNYVAVVRKDSGLPPESFEDLAGKSLVVQQGDVIQDVLAAHGSENQITSVESQEDVLKAVSQGSFDCALASQKSAMYLIDKNGWTNLAVGRHSFLSAAYSYAVPDGQAALLAQLSEGLTYLEKSGEYRRIYEKWMSLYQDPPSDLLTVLRHVAMGALPLLVLLSVFILWWWSLRRQVANKTRELQESTDQFKYVFEAANVGKALIKPNCGINANQAFADLLGYTRNELKKKNWQALIFDEDIDSIKKVLAPLRARTENGVRLEKRYVHKSGVLRWADISIAVRRDSHAKILYFIINMVDITEKKVAEKALRKSEGYQSAMIGCSPVALFSIDLHDRILTWNRSAGRIFNWTPQEIIGKRPPFIPSDGFAEFRELCTKIEAGLSFTGLEMKLVRKSGTLFDGSLSAAPVRDADGNIIGIMCAMEDISERKRAEQEREELQSQLIQAQKMESVGRLAGGVAHDYNNMLNVIMGFTELALGKISQDDPIYDDLQEVFDAARRATDITRQLLAFARKQTIAPQVLELNDTVETMLKMLRRLLGEDIDLSWQPGANLWSVNIDPSQLDQLLVNLCVNARDAITDVGKITIETQNICFDENYCADHRGFTPGEFVLLAVSDDGSGMDKATLDNLFEPFFTTKNQGKGTGLGLSTVYGIVKQNGGFVNVYSEPENGSTFRIYLPCHEQRADWIETVAEVDIPQGKGETVMIVEDEAAILKLGGTMLKALSYSVLEASTPGRAMEVADEHGGKIHLLITDVVMPDMNGRDLAEKMQTLYPKLKVLFMSGYTADVIAHRGVLDKGVKFIQKPFSKRDLAVKVHEALTTD